MKNLGSYHLYKVYKKLFQLPRITKFAQLDAIGKRTKKTRKSKNIWSISLRETSANTLHKYHQITIYYSFITFQPYCFLKQPPNSTHDDHILYPESWKKEYSKQFLSMKNSNGKWIHPCACRDPRIPITSQLK